MGDSRTGGTSPLYTDSLTWWQSSFDMRRTLQLAIGHYGWSWKEMSTTYRNPNFNEGSDWQVTIKLKYEQLPLYTSYVLHCYRLIITKRYRTNNWSSDSPRCYVVMMVAISISTWVSDFLHFPEWLWITLRGHAWTCCMHLQVFNWGELG